MSATALTRRDLHFSSPAAELVVRQPLPAWPLMLLLVGFPLWWALGAAAFMPLILAGVMAVLMLARGGTVLVPGILPWAAFLVWVAAAGINLLSGASLLAYGQRSGILLAVGIFLLYVINARDSLPVRKVVYGLLAMWLAIVLLGITAIYFPDYRLTTPVGLILPDALLENPLVRNLVLPPLAEVQHPGGAPEAFNRPAAPFPYANSWGVMFAVLTPVACAAVALVRSPLAKALLVLGMAVSFWPALATSNRGMLVGLGAAVVYVVIRLAFRGRLAAAALGLAGMLLAGGTIVATGSLQEILDRQLYSDSTSGRLSLYRQTWQATLEQPLLGYGTPQLEETIGVSLGTQGYLWMLMFSYGLVGLGLFLYFLAGAVLRTWHTPSTVGLWLHSVPVAALVMVPFYGFDVMQLTAVFVVLALLLRGRYGAE
ncbi:O-antigen ligase family protein [Arthrobacter sp. zg-Y859]|uniref:O-antigen ligase family protein n=1 Tax=Arthrobacter jinronghuae TaxID=2964609 RepID=A0ABT1NTK0_9MICC|nr:O-antigen ligase family protein [Arthrobacter jinronghuae]MCQ1951064.1 O-antigen ligase family protein [Arthrobacter jinronghuae]UWX79516.1 O-antigen ligase family protein [Arthrobacter jinronghuae]